LIRFTGNHAADGPRLWWWVSRFILMAAFLQPAVTMAYDQFDASSIPHVGPRARDNFIEYTYSDDHKVFAIAPGGGWGWAGGQASEREAREIALQQCQSHSAQTCVVYALNDRLVFDRSKWSQLWRPYLNEAQAQSTLAGTHRGARFHNLEFREQSGNLKTIADFRGSVTLVHFWGSWCPPCMRELPSLRQFYLDLKQRLPEKVAMIMLQVREPFETSLQWAQENDLADLPLYDSGVAGGGDDTLKIADAQAIQDRGIALAFPTSYVLDKQGVVIFSHQGPISDWDEYLPFFEDATNH
jgi:thiol-disulfide isomerase/thioredoxin